ncbi:MAG TPA: Xaa-Pro peptidase family protein [Gemmatimonas sp.]|uniref:M24 family metallopeptidase n=1 Tax=Gemmatimonas sp. TaxID=1962908 RepID=UPI002EDB0E83
MTDNRAVRLAGLRDALARVDLDALLVTALPNVQYLTGFSGSNALVIVTAKECVLLTDFRYATQVEQEVGMAATVRIEPSSLWIGLWSVLQAMTGVDRIGFESAHMLHRDFSRLLDQGSRWQWRPQEDLVEVLRERKDEGEIAAIEEAVAMAQKALDTTLSRLRPGLTETGVAGILEQQLREAGSEAYPFASIVASGPRSALPHARASDRVLETGDFVLIDFGAVSRGYCSDITRTVVLGRASAQQKEVYEVVLEANRRASGAVRPEMTGMAADAVAREYIDARGFGDAFGHSLGHGIGLEVHESPRLARTVEAPLATGMVVTIEPGIYRPGWGGVRIEDDVLITESGGRVLTSFPRTLLEID